MEFCSSLPHQAERERSLKSAKVAGRAKSKTDDDLARCLVIKNDGDVVRHHSCGSIGVVDAIHYEG